MCSPILSEPQQLVSTVAFAKSKFKERRVAILDATIKGELGGRLLKRYGEGEVQ